MKDRFCDQEFQRTSSDCPVNVSEMPLFSCYPAMRGSAGTRRISKGYCPHLLT